MHQFPREFSCLAETDDWSPHIQDHNTKCRSATNGTFIPIKKGKTNVAVLKIRENYNVQVDICH